LLKKLIPLFGVLLLLSGCGQEDIAIEEGPAPGASPPAPADAAREIVLLVDSDLEDIFILGAERFAYELGQLTKGELTVEVRTARDAAARLKSGGAEFAFLDSKTTKDVCRGFQALATPFLYSGYEALTMSCNAEQMRGVLDESVAQAGKTRLLAAYYGPGYHLLTTWQPTDFTRFSEAVIAVDPAGGSGEGFHYLGARVEEEADPGARIALVQSGGVQGAELTLEQLIGADWFDTDVYLTYTYHTSRPVWLAADEAFLSALTPFQSAAVTEACARIYNDIDQSYLMQEAEAGEKLAAQGVLLSRDFSAARSEIFLVEGSASEDSRDPVEAFILDFVRAIE